VPQPTPPAAPSEPIRSAANPTLAWVRSLQRRDARSTERAFVVEGHRAVADALATGAIPKLILVREDQIDAVAAWRDRPDLPIRPVAAPLFKRLTDTHTSPGLLAVFPFPAITPPAPDARSLILLLDRIRDPGNFGTLLRSAAGAGVDLVYATATSVDPFNPKVVRAAMGAHFRLPVLPFDTDAQRVVQSLPLRVAAAAAASTTYDAIDWRQPALLIIGSEADGVDADIAALATVTAAIPLAARVESLNAAMAGVVMLFEANRQRRGAPIA